MDATTFNGSGVDIEVPNPVLPLVPAPILALKWPPIKYISRFFGFGPPVHALGCGDFRSQGQNGEICFYSWWNFLPSFNFVLGRKHEDL